MRKGTGQTTSLHMGVGRGLLSEEGRSHAKGNDKSKVIREMSSFLVDRPSHL